MPLTDQHRIARDMANPRIMQLGRALSKLGALVRFINTGAHPDDETSGMLAALTFRDRIDVSVACANRGEGGQNDIGTEMTEDLGALRTAEMERAADRLDCGLYWLSEHPADSIFDFGFSKSGEETLRKWGHDRTLSRFVEIVRTERPDIICPTFLDVPGQHGHHRAMTALAHEVMDVAADPDYPGSTLPPWQVSKLYLPAWSGAGQAYDDDLPPPPATLTVPALPGDPLSGLTWDGVGQQSRACHRTQGMGRWVAPDASRDWPLHLARSTLSGADNAVADGLPESLATIHPALAEADAAIEAARAAFPNAGAVGKEAARALAAIRACKACPAQHQHRLDRQETYLARVTYLASGASVSGSVASDWLQPGTACPYATTADKGQAEALEVDLDLPSGWRASEGRLHVSDEVRHDPYRATYLPWARPAPALVARLKAHGVTTQMRLPLEVSPVVLPQASSRVIPDALILNTAAPARVLGVAFEAIHPPRATPHLDAPDGWRVEPTDEGARIMAPTELSTGRVRLGLSLDGNAAQTVRRIAYPHINPTARMAPAGVEIAVLDAALPDARIGYVGGGNDRVAHWLAAMGVEVAVLDAAQIAAGTLEDVQTLVIGIFALRTVPGLAEALPLIHQWVAEGGNLVTLYHRPWDNWDAATSAPRPLEIGQPSLRWRVTDETAEVRHLLPDHPLLTTPNPIGPGDWAGWHKERGLYFAKSWDTAYEPLLEMADPGEAPHRGSLLSARIGRGRHTHTSLILHHQMEKLVPGAFRLMANLITPGT